MAQQQLLTFLLEAEEIPNALVEFRLSAIQGVHESLDKSARRNTTRKETPEEAAARLRAESKDLRQSVRYLS